MKKKTGTFLAIILALAILMSASVMALAAGNDEPEGKLPEVGSEIGGEDGDYIYTVKDPDSANIGDVNGDGVVNIKDATVIQKHMIQIAPIAPEYINRADVDGDGWIRTSDATLIQKKLVHLAD